MIPIIIVVVGLTNIACFYLGAKVGQTVARNEKIEVPHIKSPMQMIAERKEKKVIDAENRRTEILLQNIENYNGTGMGQADVPRG